MIYKCPGQDKRNVLAETLRCPECGYAIELFSDEIRARCPRCRKETSREILPTCIDWCKHANECVGENIYKEHLKNKSLVLKDKLLKDLEEYFGEDQRRINHARKVMDFSEELLRKEGGDWHIVIPASILHDVGIKLAEKKYGSSAGHYQEKEGPEVAAGILRKENFKRKDIDQICKIIAYHHSPGKIETINFKVLYDADWLVNLKDEAGLDDQEKLGKVIERVFLTEAGKQKAKELYL